MTNLIGVHFAVRKWFLGLFKEPKETAEARGLRRLGEALRPALVAWVESEMRERPLTLEEIAELKAHE